MNEDRLKHSIAVARKMVELARYYQLTDKEVEACFVIGYHHDIGYEFASDGIKHNIIGGLILKNSHFKYWKEVYYHGDPKASYQSLYLDILNMADMQIDGLGNDVGYEGRLEDIKTRYQEYPQIYQNCCKIVSDLKQKDNLRTKRGV